MTLEIFEIAMTERVRRRPVSQIIGRRAFWRHEFEVTSAVLDPRPETETLVELALTAPFSRILDLGTGSGVILVSVLADRPKARGVGVDVSAEALEVARTNARQVGVTCQADFMVSDWFSAVHGRFDLVVSNPPYVAAAEMAGLAPEVRLFDPEFALTDGGDGLGAYRAISAGLGEHLEPGGRVLVEIGPSQAGAVSELFAAAGLEDIATHPDLDDRDRVVSAKMPV